MTGKSLRTVTSVSVAGRARRTPNLGLNSAEILLQLEKAVEKMLISIAKASGVLDRAQRFL